MRCYALGLVVLIGAIGCSRDEKLERSTFYDRKIEPVLAETCATSGTRSGCHVTQAGGNALGNLSVDSYAELTKRRDLLVDYGPYGVPGLLLKVVPPYRLGLTHWASTEPLLITTDIAHAAQTQIDFTSAAYTTIETWIRNGAAENNAKPAEPERALTPCTPTVPSHPLFDRTTDPAAPDYASFVSGAGQVLVERCGAGNCHGSPANNLHLTCGQTPEQRRWNYFAAGDYVSMDTNASELLRRALAPEAGGSFHEGGTVFRARDETDYQTLAIWATAKGGPTNVPADAGFMFFAERVQPMLVKRGCMMFGCHSSSMFHDYRLRGGSGGHFGLPATRTNYRLTLEQLALESADPKASRLVRKNLALEAGGIRHRGVNLFGDGELSTACDMVAADSGPIDEQRPYCVIAAWLERERAARMSGVAPFSSIVFVRRTPAAGADTPQDFEAFAPGAEVVQAAATVAVDGSLALGGETSLSALCGLDPASSDARRAAVSWDGNRIAFSARSSATEPYRVYLVSGGSCAPEPVINAPPADENGAPIMAGGELVHNFDPTFAPDGRVVFVSTRGNVNNLVAIGYSGPRRTPADPSKLNANLYVLEAGRVRQLTFLLNQELLPSFMRDGRVIFTTEKRAPEFYQLAGRRINLDGGDYHPLFAQRATVDYDQFTGVVELSDKNLAAIVSERGAQHGAGTLAIINRSIGVDGPSTDPADYLVDQRVVGRPNPGFYQPSFRILDPAATGKLAGTAGAYRDPSPLPDGRLIVSYAANVTNLASFSGNFDLFVVDPVTGARTPLAADATRDLLWPVAVYGKPDLGVFESRLDEANGSTRVGSGPNAEVTILDVGVLQSLLFQNTRTGRLVPGSSRYLAVWEELPPEPGVVDFASGGSFVANDRYGQYYARRQQLGAVTLRSDNSAGVIVPGGVPLVLETEFPLAGDSGPTRHFQREQMQFYPGEVARQSFPRSLFDGMCGGCHGSISGIEMDVAVNPDILTQASSVAAVTAPPNDLTTRSGAPAGPSFP